MIFCSLSRIAAYTRATLPPPLPRPAYPSANTSSKNLFVRIELLTSDEFFMQYQNTPLFKGN